MQFAQNTTFGLKEKMEARLRKMFYKIPMNAPVTFFNRHIVVFFETSVFKEVRILRYLRNNNAVLIPMLMLSSKIKLSYTILIHT